VWTDQADCQKERRLVFFAQQFGRLGCRFIIRLLAAVGVAVAFSAGQIDAFVHTLVDQTAHDLTHNHIADPVCIHR